MVGEADKKKMAGGGNAARAMKTKSEKYQSNVTKRGNVKMAKKEDGLGLSPAWIYFFVVIVVGSAVVQIFN